MLKTPSSLFKSWLLILPLLLLLVSACSQGSGPHVSSPTPAPSPTTGYSLSGGGWRVCVGEKDDVPPAYMSGGPGERPALLIFRRPERR